MVNFSDRDARRPGENRLLGGNRRAPCGLCPRNGVKPECGTQRELLHDVERLSVNPTVKVLFRGARLCKVGSPQVL